jgi:hypothetical protein
LLQLLSLSVYAYAQTMHSPTLARRDSRHYFDEYKTFNIHSLDMQAHSVYGEVATTRDLAVNSTVDMKAQEKSNTRKSGNKLQNTVTVASLVVAVAVIAIIIGGAIFLFNIFKGEQNYAEETARPIESRLVSKGAIKKCVRGDDGRGYANREPWYEAYYEVPVDQQRAIALINDAAQAEGFKLTHASPDNKGGLSVADEYIAAWYFDHTSKKSSYPTKSGAVKLAMTVNAHGAQTTCGKDTPITVDASHSVIGVRVRLPLLP